MQHHERLAAVFTSDAPATAPAPPPLPLPATAPPATAPPSTMPPTPTQPPLPSTAPPQSAAPAVYLLPSPAQGRTTAEEGQLNVLPGRRPSPTRVLQHLRWSCPGEGPMEAMGMQKLYEPSPTPILYVGLAADVLGRVPLMPLFLLDNNTPTIPHQLRQHRSARFPHGLADAADE